MKATIYNNTELGRRAEEKEMNRKELAQLRSQVAKSIRSWFKWSDYSDSMKHLVYYVEYEGQAFVYRNGWIMDETEFDELIAMRDGVTFAGAIHRLS